MSFVNASTIAGKITVSPLTGAPAGLQLFGSDQTPELGPTQLRFAAEAAALNRSEKRAAVTREEVIRVSTCTFSAV
jgi:hypothetical protein